LVKYLALVVQAKFVNCWAGDCAIGDFYLSLITTHARLQHTTTNELGGACLINQSQTTIENNVIGSLPNKQSSNQLVSIKKRESDKES
jgi:hypothetical protein